MQIIFCWKIKAKYSAEADQNVSESEYLNGGRQTVAPDHKY